MSGREVGRDGMRGVKWYELDDMRGVQLHALKFIYMPVFSVSIASLPSSRSWISSATLDIVFVNGRVLGWHCTRPGRIPLVGAAT